MSEHDKQPDPTDIYVGERVRLMRRTRNISQERLAEAIGVTFQQVQKYERGANRVSCSMVQRIADFFDLPVSEFFPKRDSQGEESDSMMLIQRFAKHPDCYKLITGFPLLNSSAQKAIVELVRALQHQDQAIAA